MKTNWKRLVNPDYLGAYSLDSGDGKYADIIATVKQVKVENVVGADGKCEDCVVAHFTENIKPMILNVTNMKTLEKLFKSKYIEDWSSRKIQIGVESIKAFGDVVDALRIRKFVPREAGPVVCADTGKEITATDKMTVAQIVAATQKRFGRPLCAERWMALLEQQKAAEEEPNAAE